MDVIILLDFIFVIILTILLLDLIVWRILRGKYKNTEKIRLIKRSI